MTRGIVRWLLWKLADYRPRAIYTASLYCNPSAVFSGNANPSAVLSLGANPSAAASLSANPSATYSGQSNPSPDEEVYSG